MGLEKDGFIRSITKIRKDTRPGKRHTQMRNPRSFLRHWLLPGWSFFFISSMAFFFFKGGGMCDGSRLVRLLAEDEAIRRFFFCFVLSFVVLFFLRKF